MHVDVFTEGLLDGFSIAVYESWTAVIAEQSNCLVNHRLCEPLANRRDVGITQVSSVHSEEETVMLTGPRCSNKNSSGTKTPSVANNVNIEMKWWPRRDGTSRHIWVTSAARDVLRDPGACGEAECIATSPGLCPCGKVEWVGVA